MWVIQATATFLDRDGYTCTRQIPTFYLDSRVQGILNRTQAVGVAMNILCSTQAPGSSIPRFEISAEKL